MGEFEPVPKYYEKELGEQTVLIGENGEHLEQGEDGEWHQTVPGQQQD